MPTNRHPLLQGPARGRNVSLPQALDEALTALAEREDRSVSRIVRCALLQYMGQPENASQPVLQSNPQ